MAILGGHVSSAGGVMKALDRAVALDFAALQIHPTAPQSWSKPAVSDEEAAAFAAAYPDKGIKGVFFHNIYLTNFATDNLGTWHGAIEVSKSYMNLAVKMKAHGVVTHLGSHKGVGMDVVLEHLVTGLCTMLDGSPEDATFLIENTAGAGGTIGRSLEEIQMILDKVWPRHKNVGICIDTCHAFAAGIPIHTEAGLDSFLSEFMSRFGMEALRCIHLNDSKNDFATNKDRHENIGDGFIGNEAFRRILCHPALQEVPFVMEVPGLENKGPDTANLERVRTLARQK